jgi:HupE / UreJ protein
MMFLLRWPARPVTGFFRLNTMRAIQCSLLALTLALMLCVPVVSAHDLPLQTIVNAFVKVDQNQMHLVVRVPLDLLRAVQFPMNGNVYDIPNSGPALQDALTKIAHSLPLWENGERLRPQSATGRLSLPIDRSFESYDAAVKSISQPTPTNASIYYEQGYLDAEVIYPIHSPQSAFSIRTLVAADIGDVSKLIVRYMPLDEPSRAFVITPASGRVSLSPRWYQAAGSFVVLGIGHILSGMDHLLFLFCLIIPYRSFRGLIAVITAFTIAHSITLLGTAYGLAPAGHWFPPFVEMAIAMSIVYMALENIVGADLKRRWIITGAFGLVHGFGFSYAMQDSLQFAGNHLLLSLLSFNIGIEVGQLAVLSVMLGALWLLRRVKALSDRTGVIVLSAIVAHTAWHWMMERYETLRQVGLPKLDADSIVVLARWVLAALIVGGVAVAFNRWRDKRTAVSPATDRGEPIPIAAPQVGVPPLDANAG